MDFTILIGTMTGTAELVAEEVEGALEKAGHTVARLLMDDLAASVFDDRGRVYLVCTATYGDGEVPDNALAFYEGLERDAPALGGVSYGVIGLGDSVYETFGRGGEQFDELLAKLGARRIGAVCQHDASTDVLPERLAVEWLAGWLKEVETANTATA